MQANQVARAEQRGYFGEGDTKSAPPPSSVGVHASRGPTSPSVSVQSSSYVSEENKVDNTPSPELGGRATNELR